MKLQREERIVQKRKTIWKKKEKASEKFLTGNRIGRHNKKEVFDERKDKRKWKEGIIEVHCSRTQSCRCLCFSWNAGKLIENPTILPWCVGAPRGGLKVFSFSSSLLLSPWLCFLFWEFPMAILQMAVKQWTITDLLISVSTLISRWSNREGKKKGSLLGFLNPDSDQITS